MGPALQEALRQGLSFVRHEVHHLDDVDAALDVAEMKIEADERDASMRNRRPPARIAPPATNWFDKHKPRRAPSGSPPPPARELNEDEQREADAEAARAELGAAARLGDGSLPSRFCGVKAVYFAGEVFRGTEITYPSRAACDSD